jgi:hypothetical protein
MRLSYSEWDRQIFKKPLKIGETKMIKKLIKNDLGKISWMKTGTWIVGVAGSLLAGGFVPASAIAAVKVLVGIGGIVLGIGARDALNTTTKA